MRVIYLHQYFNTLDMVGGTRSYEMARRLARDGVLVEVITARTDGRYTGLRRVQLEENLIIHWIPVKYNNKMGFFRRLFSFFYFSIISSFIAARLKADVVFATSTPLTIIIPAFFVKLIRGTPIVFEVRDLWPETPIASGVLKNRALQRAALFLEKFAYSVSHSIIALSPGMRDGVVRVKGFEENVFVIPNGSDTEMFGGDDELDVSEIVSGATQIFSKPVILYAGTIGIVNGLEFLVELSCKMGGLANILVVGDGNRKEAIENLAKQRGVFEKSFFIRPFVKKRDVPVLFRCASMGANITAPVEAYKNNSANKFFDSLASGRAVLLNQRGWMSEIVEGSNAGFLLEDLDDEAAVSEFADFITSASKVKSSGEAAYSLAQELFDREKLYFCFKGVLERAAASKFQ